MTDTRLLGMGQPPPPPPWPMIWPPYQPTVYVERERNYTHQVETPCEWYEDLQSAGDTVYCRAPAMWLVIAGVGAATLFLMMRGKR